MYRSTSGPLITAHGVHPSSKHDGADDLPFARACIEIDKHNLLPLAGQHLGRARWARSNPGPSNAARTWLWPLSSFQGLFVVVFRIVWITADNGGNIMLTARFKLQRREGCGASGHEKMQQTLCGEMKLLEVLAKLRREV